MRLASLSTVELTCFQQTPGANYLPLGESNLPAAIAPQLAPERKRGIVIGQKLQCGKLAPGVSPNAVSGRGTSRRPSGQGKGKSLLEERLLSILAGLFGGLALLLAAIGIYGTLSYTVIRRTREIGIRIAVGAERTAVLWLVMRQTLAMAGAGLALGIPLVFLARSYIESELFGLGGTDPVAIGGAAVVLASVALAAGAWPAWRASRLDPMVSLREE